MIHRSELQIVADLLSAMEGGTKKTWAMYKARLSYDLLKKYLKKTLKADLIRLNDSKMYDVTSKGVEFLLEYQKYLHISESLKSSEEDLKREKDFLNKMLSL